MDREIQKLVRWFRVVFSSGLRNLRPWGSFFERFSLPKDYAGLEKRVFANLSHFSSNYTAIGLLVLFYHVIYYPRVLSVVLLLVPLWSYVLLIHKGPVSLSPGSKPPSVAQKVSALVATSIALLYLLSCFFPLISTVAWTGTLSVLHACFRTASLKAGLSKASADARAYMSEAAEALGGGRRGAGASRDDLEDEDAGSSKGFFGRGSGAGRAAGVSSGGSSAAVERSSAALDDPEYNAGAAAAAAAAGGAGPGWTDHSEGLGAPALAGQSLRARGGGGPFIGGLQAGAGHGAPFGVPAAMAAAGGHGVPAFGAPGSFDAPTMAAVPAPLPAAAALPRPGKRD